MSDRQTEHSPPERIPPELDPWFERYDDDGPPRTLRRRMQPVIWAVAALTLASMVLLVTGAL